MSNPDQIDILHFGSISWVATLANSKIVALLITQLGGKVDDTFWVKDLEELTKVIQSKDLQLKNLEEKIITLEMNNSDQNKNDLDDVESSEYSNEDLEDILDGEKCVKKRQILLLPVSLWWLYLWSLFTDWISWFSTSTSQEIIWSMTITKKYGFQM